VAVGGSEKDVKHNDKGDKMMRQQKEKYLHKGKKFLLNTNNHSHTFQMRCKMMSLNNLYRISAPPKSRRKPK